MRSRVASLVRLFGRRMPKVDGTVEVTGTDGPVVIRRDGYGVPHIRADSDDDAWFALGFCQGQDRTFQIETRVRLGRGRLAELLGPDGVQMDAVARRIGFARVAAQQLDQLDESGRSGLDAFARGVRAGFAQGLEKRPHEFALLRQDPLDFEPADVLAALQLISFLLASNWDSEIVRLRILRDDGPEALRQLDPTYPDDLGVSTQLGAMEAPLDSLSESIEAFLDFGGAGSGSNNWAVSGSRTRSGRPIVANDPHLSPALPPHWYLSHITTPEWEAAGASLVGTPGFSLGHNGKVAWGVTAGQTDNTDLFVEELRNHDRECRNPDGWGETETWTETIEVARGRDVEIRLVRTPRGMVISEALEGDHGALSMKATWQRLVGARGILTAHRANDVEDLAAHFDPWPALPINLVSGDTGGRIGWKLVGDAPIRTKGHGVIPLPGWDPDVGWKDVPVRFDHMPGAVDPPSGWLATANNKATHETEPWLTHDWLDGYRVTRIGEVLDERTDWSPEDFGELMLDRRTLVWRDLRDMVRSADVTGSDGALALELLDGWDGTSASDSVAAAVFELWVASMCRRVTMAKAPHAAEWAIGRSVFPLSGPGSVGSRRIQHLVATMTDRPDGWFDHSWDREAGDALAEAVGQLRTQAGDDPTQWAWGTVRPLTLEHPMGQIGPMGKLFNLGPFPWGGSAHTINNGGVNLLDPFSNPVGIASLRMVVPVGEWDDVRISLPGGQSGNPASPHYDDMVPAWLSGEGVPLPWSDQAVRDATVHVLTLVPALT